ncbi:glutamine amidotransferase family protein [Tsuneonella sp. CC-YZS046]|uniref:class II glutamine amidotransferase n=1 Tax=Tsuneonella sp. CC-YZS046 TaxID=3042152 RepID=UPI002D7791B8|nr:glutamine amidotransferase family protein [Tsuneonella sp. CC-YZS046]WRO66971.1 glutamine amidotransferase family protein [Tsuneonella sp. CC-YZS046]
MCGIVGLFLKSPALEPQLGAMLADMLEVMTGRGPDSAGFAVYGAGDPGRLKLTLRGGDLTMIAQALGDVASAEVRDTHMVLSVPRQDEERVRAWLAANRPDVVVTGAGQRIELYKEVGLPAQVARRFGLDSMSGTHGIGHTRMATESAVTTDGAHPFSTGQDQCLVHNGSLSNHRSLRRMLEPQGIRFATDNDSEVAAGYLTWKMREGASLAQALEASLDDLDGFFTFVVGTESGFAVLRDPISCKPAVMAETDDYVAFGSEYRALAGLPGIEGARVFEPEPARVYAWERH